MDLEDLILKASFYFFFNIAFLAWLLGENLLLIIWLNGNCTDKVILIRASLSENQNIILLNATYYYQLGKLP